MDKNTIKNVEDVRAINNELSIYEKITLMNLSRERKIPEDGTVHEKLITVLKDTPSLIKSVSVKLITKEFMMELLEAIVRRYSKFDLEWISHISELYMDKNIRRKALESWSENIKYMSIEYDDLNEDDCMRAIRSERVKIKYLPSILITKRIMIEAFVNHRYSFKHVKPEFMDEKICLLALQRDPENIKYIPFEKQTKEMFNKYGRYSINRYYRYINPIFQTEELNIKAVTINPHCIALIDNITDKVYTAYVNAIEKENKPKRTRSPKRPVKQNKEGV